MKIGRLVIDSCRDCVFCYGHGDTRFSHSKCLQGAWLGPGELPKEIPESCPFNNLTTQVLFNTLYNLNYK